MGIVLTSRKIATVPINLVRPYYVEQQKRARAKEVASDTRNRNEDDKEQKTQERLEKIREKPSKSPVAADRCKRAKKLEQENIQIKHVSNSNNYNMTTRSKNNINKNNAVILLGDKIMDADLYGDSREEETTFLQKSGYFRVVPGSEAKYHS